jgi:pimeloyl-ACP methyl ester carboxylesterase
MPGPTLRLFGSSLPARCALLLGLLGASGCALQRQNEAVLVLGDVAAGAGPSSWKERTPQPSRTPITYRIDGRDHIGDLYLPGEGKPEAGIVLVPGMVQEGKDAPNFVTFATTLARARFAVVAPQLSGHRDLRMEPGQAREVADAFRYLADRADLSPDGRAGIAGISYALGPVVLAALEHDIRERVRFIFGVGGYYDLRTAIRFVTTGYFEVDGLPRTLQASQYGKLLLVKSILQDLHDPNDRAIFEEMVEVKLKDFNADISTLAEALGPEGMSVHRLLNNTDPQLTPRLIAALPPASVATIDALTLSNKDLTRLHARLLLIHGKNDALIPYPESVALGRAVAPSQARVFVLNGVLGHVDFTMSRFFSMQFWSKELPDAWRLFRVANLLLKEREKPASTMNAAEGRGSQMPAVSGGSERTGSIGAKPVRSLQ